MNNAAYIQEQLNTAIESYKIAKNLQGLDKLTHNILCANIRYNAQVIIEAAYKFDELLSLRCEARRALDMP